MIKRFAPSGARARELQKRALSLGGQIRLGTPDEAQPARLELVANRLEREMWAATEAGLADADRLRLAELLRRGLSDD